MAKDDDGRADITAGGTSQDHHMKDVDNEDPPGPTTIQKDRDNGGPAPPPSQDEDDDDLIDYNNVINVPNLSIETLEGFRYGGERSNPTSRLQLNFMCYRHTRLLLVRFFRDTKLSLNKIHQLLDVLVERLSKKSGTRLCNIRSHPAAHPDSSETWRKLPTKYVGPRMTDSEYRVFITKFIDAAGVDVALMAEEMGAALAEAAISDQDFALRFPEDNGPYDDHAIREYIHGLDQDAFMAEELMMADLAKAAREGLYSLLRILSLFHQSTANIRRQLRDAIALCNHVDPIFHDRGEKDQQAVYHKIIERAIADNILLHESTLYNQSLWSTVAFIPLRPQVQILLEATGNILKIRNSIARVLRHGLEARGFEQEEEVRRGQELEASRLARVNRLYDEALTRVVLDEGDGQQETEVATASASNDVGDQDARLVNDDDGGHEALLVAKEAHRNKLVGIQRELIQIGEQLDLRDGIPDFPMANHRREERVVDNVPYDQDTEMVDSTGDMMIEEREHGQTPSLSGEGSDLKYFTSFTEDGDPLNALRNFVSNREAEPWSTLDPDEYERFVRETFALWQVLRCEELFPAEDHKEMRELARTAMLGALKYFAAHHNFTPLVLTYPDSEGKNVRKLITNPWLRTETAIHDVEAFLAGERRKLVQPPGKHDESSSDQIEVVEQGIIEDSEEPSIKEEKDEVSSSAIPSSKDRVSGHGGRSQLNEDEDHTQPQATSSQHHRSHIDDETATPMQVVAASEGPSTLSGAPGNGELKVYQDKENGWCYEGGTPAWEHPFPSQSLKDLRNDDLVARVGKWALARPVTSDWLAGATFYQLAVAWFHLSDIVSEDRLDVGRVDDKKMSPAHVAACKCAADIINKIHETTPCLPTTSKATWEDTMDLTREDSIQEWHELYNFL